MILRCCFLCLVLLIQLEGKGQGIFSKESFQIDSSYLFSRHQTCWFDANQDAKLDYLSLSIKNQNNRLYFFDQQGFVEQTSSLSEEGGNSQGATVADIDQDGDLDVFVYSIFGQKSSLFRQIEPGVYRKEFGQALLQLETNIFKAEFVDIDDDADQDLLLAEAEIWDPKNIKKSMSIWLNDGKGFFSRKEMPQFQNPNSNARSFILFDYNSDQQIDILELNFGSANRLFVAETGLLFKEIFFELSEEKGDWIDGVVTDINNDGAEDLLLLDVQARVHVYLRDFGKFRKAEIQQANFKIAAGISALDLDADGLIDFCIMEQDGRSIEYFRNTLARVNNSIDFTLRSSKKNAFGIGGRVQVKYENEGKICTAEQVIRQSRVLPHDQQMRAHFGVGSANRVEDIMIHWPDGSIQQLPTLYVNEHYFLEQLQEPKLMVRPIDLKQSGTVFNDLEIRMQCDTFLMGELSSLTLQYINHGSIATDVVIQLDFKIPINFVNAYPTVEEVSSQKIRWSLKNVAPGSQGSILLNIKNLLDASIIEQEQMIKVRIANGMLDENLQNNQQIIISTIK